MRCSFGTDLKKLDPGERFCVEERRRKESIEKYEILNPLIVRPVPDAIGRNINKYHRFLHDEIKKFERKTEEKTV